MGIAKLASRIVNLEKIDLIEIEIFFTCFKEISEKLFLKYKR
jgi:hypothetical protein